MNDQGFPKHEVIITWTKDDSFLISDMRVFHVPTRDDVHDLSLSLQGKPYSDIGRHCAGWEEVTLSMILLRLLNYWPKDKSIQNKIMKELSKISEWSEEISTFYHG